MEKIDLTDIKFLRKALKKAKVVKPFSSYEYEMSQLKANAEIEKNATDMAYAAIRSKFYVANELMPKQKKKASIN